jgi:Poly(ADP-ribose) polymerase catalytic domain
MLAAGAPGRRELQAAGRGPAAAGQRRPRAACHPAVHCGDSWPVAGQVCKRLAGARMHLLHCLVCKNGMLTMSLPSCPLHVESTATNYEAVPPAHELHGVAQVLRKGEAQRFQQHKELGNRRLLWHGTNVAVVAAVLKTGLRIMPHSGGRVGRPSGLLIVHAFCVHTATVPCLALPCSCSTTALRFGYAHDAQGGASTWRASCQSRQGTRSAASKRAS